MVNADRYGLYILLILIICSLLSVYYGPTYQEWRSYQNMDSLEYLEFVLIVNWPEECLEFHHLKSKKK